MKLIWSLIYWLREPWLTQKRAASELRRYWPNRKIIIDPRAGRVRIYRGDILMTSQPTLKQAMDRIRKYCSGSLSC